jgi:integrase/recombinase XerD
MGVTLRKRKNADGTISLRLDIIHEGKRWIETMQHLKLNKAVNAADRERNKENLRLAESIANARRRELEAQGYDVPTDGRKTLVLEWMQAYCDNYKKKDARNMQGAKNRFAAFINENRLNGLTFGRLTEAHVKEFWDYLVERSIGEGASSYFNRFKKMMKHAHSKRIITHNVAANVMARGGGESAKKEVLTLEEIQTLARTKTENEQVKRAFLFCCVTGLRFIDVKSLLWDNIDLNEGLLSFRQSKTGRSVAIPLNETAANLLDKPNKGLVFDLPSANGCNKTLKAWVKRAGINKAITWHNARHSFGTNLILHKHDIVTTSKLMGHTTLRHTQRYVDSASELKRAAVNSLKINL